MKKIFAVLATLLVLASAFGCAVQPQTPTASAITVTDDAGTTITLAAPATKIIAMNPADAEILYAIGASESIVALGEYCNYPAETDSVKKVGTGNNTNLEELIALKPDLIILSTMAQTEEQVAALNSAGIQVLTSWPNSVEETYVAIERLGAVTGKADSAAAVVKGMKDEFAEIAKLVEGAEKKSAYMEVSPLMYGLWTCGKDTFQDEIMSLAGVENAFADLTSWAEVSEEQVISRNPDYIFTTELYPTPEEGVAEILGREGWQTISAVENARVISVDPDIVSRAGPRLAEATRLIYEAVYGGN